MDKYIASRSDLLAGAVAALLAMAGVLAAMLDQSRSQPSMTRLVLDSILLAC